MHYEKIRQLRKAMELTQEDFAFEVGSTTVSINRWENGKAQPSKVYKRRLKELAEKHGIILL
jgi:DNA-binding transcriptional regulator YiaG